MLLGITGHQPGFTNGPFVLGSIFTNGPFVLGSILGAP